jgi:hypothetical protein
MERKEKKSRRPNPDKKMKFPYRSDMALQHIDPNVIYVTLSFVHPCCKITFLSAYHVHCLRLSLVLREPAYPASVSLRKKQ